MIAISETVADVRALSRLIMDKISHVKPGTLVVVATGVKEDVFLQLEIRGVTVEFDRGTVTAISRPCGVRHGKGVMMMGYLFSTALREHRLWPGRHLIDLCADTFFHYNTQRYNSTDIQFRVAADAKPTIVFELLDSQPVSDINPKAKQFISEHTGECAFGKPQKNPLRASSISVCLSLSLARRFSHDESFHVDTLMHTCTHAHSNTQATQASTVALQWVLCFLHMRLHSTSLVIFFPLQTFIPFYLSCAVCSVCACVCVFRVSVSQKQRSPLPSSSRSSRLWTTRPP